MNGPLSRAGMLILLALGSGCQMQTGAAPSTADATRADAPPPPEVQRSEAPRIDAWRCEEAGHPISIYDRGADSMELYLRGELRTLQRSADVPPAYSDGAVTLRLDPQQRGADTAILQILPMQARCELDPVASAELRAWQRGATLLGRGNEPGWTLEIRADAVVWISDYGSTRRVFGAPEALPPNDVMDAEGQRLLARGPEGTLAIHIIPGLCVDAGDVAYPNSIVLQYEDRSLRGCGRRLRDPQLPGLDQMGAASP